MIILHVYHQAVLLSVLLEIHQQQLVDGLTAATLYDVYVRSICSTPTPSNWTQPASFNTTICEVANQCLY
ncbi:hypothetical protein EQG68_14910 [Flavobacterium piscinae]|uniref:Uncharacterized protein n=1 Tax=Flavobacterium piscinae TaxID=2506424 RepID=A0A4Q1KEJ6_9FLAO|nr:hypothetical protein EQG68_14910 [Flavobacterium piscinae]